jgi:hypothetical protein
MSPNGSTGPEPNASAGATEVATSASSANPPPLDQVVQDAMDEAGVTDLSNMTKAQAEAFHRALQHTQDAQETGDFSGTTQGLKSLVSSVGQAIKNWPSDGETALEIELSNQTGLQGVLRSLSQVVGNGNVGLPAEVDAALTKVEHKISALNQAINAIEQQIPLGAPGENHARQYAERTLDSIDALKDAGLDLESLQLDELRTELNNQLALKSSDPPDPVGDDQALRKGVLSALGSYFNVSGLSENSPQVLRNNALMAGASVAAEEHSMDGAWESEARSITNLKSFGKDELDSSVKQLMQLRADAIRRGDLVAAYAIGAKIEVLTDALSKIESGEVLGDEGMIIGAKLRAIDLGTKQVLLDKLKAAKADADKSGDDNLIKQLEGEIASMQSEINVIEQELKVVKEKTLEVIEDTTEKTVRNLQDLI